MSVPTTLLELCHAREVAGYCPVGVQGTVLGIADDLGALSYLLCLFSGPYRAGVSGRLVLVGSNCVSQSRVVSRGSAHPVEEVGQSQKWCWASPFGRRGHPKAG